MSKNLDRVVEHLQELNGADVTASRIWPELQVILTIVDREDEVPREQASQIAQLARALESGIPEGERTRVSKWLDRLGGEPQRQAEA